MSTSLSKHVLLLLAVLLPLSFVPVAFVGFDALKFSVLWAGTVVAAFGLLIGKLQAPEVRLPINPIAVSAVAVVLLTAISAIASPVIGVSIGGEGFSVDSLLVVLTLFALFGMSSYVFSERTDVMRLHSVIMAAFLALTLFESVRLILRAFDVSYPSLGFFAEPWINTIGKWNDLAIILGLGVVMTMTANYVLSVKRSIANLLIVASVLALGILIVINFRAMWVVLGITSIAVFGYAMTYGARTGKRIAPIFPIAVALLSCVMIIDNVNPNRALLPGYVNQVLEIGYAEIRPDWGGTLTIAKSALSHDPILGVGPSRFVREWHLSRPEGVNQTQFWGLDFQYGVGYLPTTLVTLGILGFLAWVAFVGSILFYSVRGILRTIDDGVMRYATVSTGVAVVYLWAFSIMYVPGIVVLALTFMLTGSFIGMLSQQGLISARIISFKDDQRHNFIYVFATVFLMMLTIVFAYTCGKKIIAQVYFERADAAITTGDTAKAFLAIDRAAFFSLDDTYFRAASDIQMIELARIVQATSTATDEATRSQQVQGLLNGAIQSSQSAIAIDPTDYQNFAGLATVYRAAVPAEGTYDMSISLYEEAAKLAPSNPGIRLNQAIAAALQGDLQRSAQYVEMALQLKPDFVEAINLLNQLRQAASTPVTPPEVEVPETATSTTAETPDVDDVSGVEDAN
jgi:hypothetical protein